MMSGRRTLSCSLLIFLTIFAGCQHFEEVRSPNSESRTVRDDLGRDVRVPVTIERAVSLAPNLTETVFAVGAGDRLVGVTTFCNYPEEARSIRKVGDTLNPNMESIVALKPDVVLVSTASQIEAFTQTLDMNGIAVFVTNPDSLEDVFANLQKLGELFGTGELAESRVSKLRERVDRVAKNASGHKSVRVFVQIDKESMYTIGRSSFITDIVERAGGRSVTDDVAMAYFPLSKETALALSPDVIILSDSDNNREPNDVFRGSPAMEKGRVLRVDADLLSRPGPRLVNALEQIAAYLKQVDVRNGE